MALSTFFIAIYISVLLMTIFFIFHSFFLLTVDVFQDFFSSIIIQSFFFLCHPLLHVYTDLLAVDCFCCLIFGRQAWDALLFGGGGKSLGFCFYRLEKFLLGFVYFFLL